MYSLVKYTRHSLSSKQLLVPHNESIHLPQSEPSESEALGKNPLLSHLSFIQIMHLYTSENPGLQYICWKLKSCCMKIKDSLAALYCLLGLRNRERGFVCRHQDWASNGCSRRGCNSQTESLTICMDMWSKIIWIQRQLESACALKMKHSLDMSHKKMYCMYMYWFLSDLPSLSSWSHLRYSQECYEPLTDVLK